LDDSASANDVPTFLQPRGQAASLSVSDNGVWQKLFIIIAVPAKRTMDSSIVEDMDETDFSPYRPDGKLV